MPGLYRSPGAKYRRLGSPPAYGGFSIEDPLIDVSSVTSQSLPASGEWDESTGTVYLEDGNGNKRAVAWSPAGYVAVENGVTLDQYPPVWLDPTQSGGGTKYYVATDGSDANDGTDPLTQGGGVGPKQTLAAGVALLSAGDTLSLRQGQTWNETLTPTSGAEGNVIKFTCHGGVSGEYDPEQALPIIDGQYTRNQTLNGNSGKSYLWFDRLDFYRGNSVTSPSSTSASFTGQVNFNGGSTDVTISNCVVRYAGGSAIFFGDDTNSCRVYNTHVHHCPAWGITMRNTGGGASYDSGNVCAMNEINDCCLHTESSGTGSEAIQGFGHDAQIYGNYVHDCDTGDTLCYRDWMQEEPDGVYGMVRIFNNIFDCYNATKSFAPLAMKGKGGRSYRNIVRTFSLYGIEATIPNDNQGSGDDKYNESYCHHSVIYDGSYGTYANDSVHLFSNGFQKYADSNGEYNVHNNTVDDGAAGWGTGVDFLGDEANDSFRSKNNLVTNMTRAGARFRTAYGTMEADYNYYYNVNDQWEYTGTNRTWSYWTTTLGFDTNGTSTAGDPLYADATNANMRLRDYSLGASSPARSKGTDVVYLVDTDPNSWIGINFIPHATSPDAGAYQYLAGKTLDFSKWFLGLKCNGGTAQRLKLWKAAKDEASLQTMTT